MVTEKDKQWLKNQGDRVVSPNVGAVLPKTDDIDEILDAKKKGLKYKAFESAAGLSGEGAPQESLAATIVSKSMDVTQKTIDRMNDDAKGLFAALEQARAEREMANEKLWTERMNSIKAAQEKLEKSASNAANAGAPRSEFEIYRAVHNSLREFLSEERASQPQAAAPAGISGEIQLRIKQMELDQQRLLFQMQQTADRDKREWDLRLLQLQEDSKARWAEYNENKKMKEDGLGKLGGILGAVGMAIQQERGVVPVSAGAQASTPAPAAGGAPTAAPPAQQKGFPCEQCQTFVPVVEGEPNAKCPNEQCGQTYEVSWSQT